MRNQEFEELIIRIKELENKRNGDVDLDSEFEVEQNV